MTEERLQRRLGAILAADVVGYSRLMGADDEDVGSRRRQHRVLPLPLLTRPMDAHKSPMGPADGAPAGAGR